MANCELVHPDRQGRRASLSITPSPAAGQLSRRHRHHVGSPHSAGSQTCAVMPPPPFRAIRRPATLLQLLPPSSARSIEKREIAGCVTESSRLDMMVLLCCATQSYTHHGAYDYACRAVPGGGSQRRARRSCPIKGCGHIFRSPGDGNMCASAYPDIHRGHIVLVRPSDRPQCRGRASGLGSADQYTI